MVMQDTTHRVEAAAATPPMSTLAAAVLAPFGVIAIMAFPLLFDAARSALGI